MKNVIFRFNVAHYLSLFNLAMAFSFPDYLWLSLERFSIEYTEHSRTSGYRFGLSAFQVHYVQSKLALSNVYPGVI